MMRNGESIQTFTGNQFYPMDPREDEIRIEDIAHSLSLQCRYAGHVKTFYSVAQHSVMVARIVPVQDALWGLMHDASEAYLVDLPAPIKRSSRLGEEYQKIESSIMALVAGRFGMSIAEPSSIKTADMRLLATEMRDLMGRTIASDAIYQPLPWLIDPWSPERSEVEFLSMAHLLGVEEVACSI